jgi:hypothetical protein
VVLRHVHHVHHVVLIVDHHVPKVVATKALVVEGHLTEQQVVEQMQLKVDGVQKGQKHVLVLVELEQMHVHLVLVVAHQKPEDVQKVVVAHAPDLVLHLEK